MRSPGAGLSSEDAIVKRSGLGGAGRACAALDWSAEEDATAAHPLTAATSDAEIRSDGYRSLRTPDPRPQALATNRTPTMPRAWTNLYLD
jgi:hypothetical protein